MVWCSVKAQRQLYIYLYLPSNKIIRWLISLRNTQNRMLYIKLSWLSSISIKTFFVSPACDKIWSDLKGNWLVLLFCFGIRNVHVFARVDSQED
jgi:hypothetical protein